MALQEPPVDECVADPEQSNESDQDGAVIATAASDYVEVEQSGALSAGVTGITAISSAVATAQLGQTANQHNDSATTVSGPDVANGKVSLFAELGQSNENEQEGVAIAAAVSDYVSVEKNGDLASGDGGIIAQSKAVAIASIDQQADQENSASQSASLESGTITEEQSVEQTNRNEQEGLAVATAESDYVSVNNYGDVLNANSDGIDAESTAVAVATVTQEANQTNSASQNGTTTAAPSTVSLSQSLNQANFNEQEGIAIAVASADDVKVTSQGFVDPPGDGIHAESSAVAVAAVDQ